MDVPPRRPLLPRLLPAVGLAFLAPWVAEYLLGLHTVPDLPILVFLVPLYGGGALLVREVTRRTGRGWPTMLLLAAAYGLIEAGLVDQSLFNPDYSGYDFQTAAHVPGLDVSAFYAVSFVAGHALYSIGTPILLVESLVPARRTRPWLRTPGLVVAVLLYLLGAAIIFVDVRETGDGFTASPLQLGVAAAGAVALVVAAFAVRPAAPAPGRRAPRVRTVAVLAFVAAGVFSTAHESWAGAAYAAAVVVLACWAIRRWSRSPAWSPRHRVALAGGALLTYAWLAVLLPPWRDVSPAWERASEAAFAVFAVALVAVAARRGDAADAERHSRPVVEPSLSGPLSARGTGAERAADDGRTGRRGAP
jgi:hypothetical protein